MQLIPASLPFGDPCGRRPRAAFVAATCGPGRPGLLHCHPGGLTCTNEQAPVHDSLPPRAASMGRLSFGGIHAFIRRIMGLVFRTKEKENTNF